MTQASMPPPRDLAARLRSVAAHSSPAARILLQEITDNPAAVSQLTVREFAKRAGTSTASVVRLAKDLGFPGYSQLRLGLAALSSTHSNDTAVPLGGDIASDDPPRVIIDKLVMLESLQLKETADLLDAEVLDEAAHMIASARRVVVLGVGGSGIVAQDLSSKLSRLGIIAQSLTAIDSAMPIVCLLNESDVVVALSHSGGTGGTVEPFACALEQGAKGIAITGVPRSDIALKAHRVLLTAGREIGIRSAAIASRTGQLLACDALFVRTAQLVPGSMEALRRTYVSVRRELPQSERDSDA